MKCQTMNIFLVNVCLGKTGSFRTKCTETQSFDSRETRQKRSHDEIVGLAHNRGHAPDYDPGIDDRLSPGY